MNNLSKVIGLGGRRLNRALAMHYLFSAKEPQLPEGYIPLKYLKSTGTQYIDLGITPSDDMEFEVTYQVTSGSGKLYGAEVSGIIFDAYGVTPTSGMLRAFKHSNTGGTVTTITTVANEKVNLKMVIKDGTYSVYINNDLVNTAPVAGTPPNDTMYLFACNRNGKADALINAISRGCTVKKSGELVGDFKPFLTNEGEAGLLNIVDMKFHPNIGTGVFEYEYSVDSYVQSKIISFTDAEKGLDGTTLKNLVGDNYDMTITGSLPYADKGLTFDGTINNYINVPEFTELANTAEVTFEMAVNLTDIKTTQRILYLKNFFEFFVRNKLINTDLHFDGAPTENLQGTANTGFITFAAVFKANEYQKLFINGVEVASTTAVSPSSVPSSGTIGGNGYALANGSKFYSMRVYKRALTAEELARNYAIDKARFGLEETAAATVSTLLLDDDEEQEV